MLRPYSVPTVTGGVFMQQTSRGLRYGDYSPCTQFSCVPTPMPHPTLPSGIELS